MPTEEARLTITLVGPDDQGGNVLFGDFRGFCANLSLCLRRTEMIVTGDAKLDYRIDEMRSGSATLTLVPVPPKEEEPVIKDRGGLVCRLFIETVHHLQSGGNIDPRFKTDDLQAFRGLAAPRLGRRFQDVRIAGKSLTSEYVANIDKILNTTIPSDGSVTGRLERLNIHNRREFALYPPITGFSVTCSFPDDMFPQVQAAIRKNVTVHGKLVFRPDSPFPERVQVRSIEIHPPDAELPTLRSLRGMLRGALDGATVVSFLKARRDD
jgi:hypothetical protein